jgi:hypothetical protein
MRPGLWRAPTGFTIVPAAAQGAASIAGLRAGFQED